jgi:hypothetical protein
VSHTIYHIPGVKVGCTNDFVRRKSDYPGGTVFEIIEILEDFSDELAGDREFEWADYFGYTKGWHYKDTLATRTKEQRQLDKIKADETKRTNGTISNGGKEGAKRQWELGKNPFQTMTSAQNSANGRARFEKPGEREKQAAISTEVWTRAGHKEMMGQKQADAWAKPGARAARSEITKIACLPVAHAYHQCPHCSHVGQGNSMFRWHFDNCRNK